MAKSDPLAAYQAKRDFTASSEPAEGGVPNEAFRAFVVQKHWATRLHYDFRLELDGSMKSWAIPKGPSLDPRDKRMAVHVEDHPIAYNAFEGVIPPKQYGAGKVIIWDKGIWVPRGDPRQGYQDGNLKFELYGHKLRGKWALVRMKGKNETREAWLLIKEKDAYARSAEDYSIVEHLTDSVAKLKPPPFPPSAPPASGSPASVPMPAGKRPAKQPKPAAGDPVMPREAAKAALPAALAPQLATLASTPPGDPEEWSYEIKFDGYRMFARVDAKHIRLYTRNGHDWTSKLPLLVAALKQQNLAPGWYDGEIVVPNADGIPDFQALQNAFEQTRTDEIVYYLFDLPYYNGFDLRAAPLTARKALLGTLLARPVSPLLRYSETIDARPQDALDSACRLGLEGVIGKRKASGYASRRSTDWIKLKCVLRQEFVIGGYTPPQGSRSGLGSLLLGVHDDKGKLQYAGNVGTGFDRPKLDDLKKRLDAIRRRDSPFAGKTGIESKAQWVEPTLVAEISFSEWTRTGRIRHSVYRGLRADKPAQAIVREQPVSLRSETALPAMPVVSHPDRVIDPVSQTTKLDLVRFYARVGDLMMVHLKDRPVSLVRAPDGVDGQLFFQKHLDHPQMSGVRSLDRALDPDHPSLLEIAKREGLLSAAQLNVIEFHTWNARKTNIAKPDRMTFDLDPGEGVAWPMLQASAHLVREFLQQLDLKAFIKTSGGKGLHIVVPLRRVHDWDTVKGFSRAIVQHLATTLPQHFSARSGPANRVGRVFIDYLRNGYGATTVSAWSARARSGLGVSVPIAWLELDALSGSAHWTVANIASRLPTGNSPWDDYDRSAQTLSGAMKTLGFARSGRR